MNDDFQLAQPHQGDFSQWQFARYTPTAAVTDNDGAGEMATIDEMHPLAGKLSDDNTKVFFGETVTSIRSLMKRYASIFIGTYNSDGPTFENEGYRRELSYLPPYVETTKARRNNYVSYFHPAFVVVRGSIRYKANYIVKGNTYESSSTDSGKYPDSSLTNWLMAERLPSRETSITIVGPVQNLGNYNSAQARLFFPTGLNGACFTECDYQPTLEWEVPFYSNTRFYLGTYITNVGVDTDESIYLNPTMTQANNTMLHVTGWNAASNFLQLWHAAGDDFSLSFFLGTPMVFIDVT